MIPRWYTASPANDGTGRVVIERYKSRPIYLRPEDARALRDEIDAAIRAASPPVPMCRMEGCSSFATHGPEAEAVVCWSHAGSWVEVGR